ncbi:hypothetical protein DFH09DRAFT_1072508 [Mycena vulgaris]|nr:hypothetical protein DFH09DRAFT_1072508 [Mycena vulgaris]
MFAPIDDVWNDNHPAIRSFNEYFSGKKSHLRNRQAADWIRTLGLVPTPELEAILSAPLISLMVHPGLSDISEHECHTRVMGVGSVLLQLLAVQHKLKEPLDLNGDLIEDLLDNSVVPCRSDGDDAFNVMFAALESSPAESGVLVQQMLKFKRDHTVFDEEFQPPTFRRDRPSHIQPNIAIPVVVGGRNIESVRLGVFGAPTSTSHATPQATPATPAQPNSNSAKRAKPLLQANRADCEVSNSEIIGRFVKKFGIEIASGGVSLRARALDEPLRTPSVEEIVSILSIIMDVWNCRSTEAGKSHSWVEHRPPISLKASNNEMLGQLGLSSRAKSLTEGVADLRRLEVLESEIFAPRRRSRMPFIRVKSLLVTVHPRFNCSTADQSSGLPPESMQLAQRAHETLWNELILAEGLFKADEECDEEIYVAYYKCLLIYSGPKDGPEYVGEI